MSTALRYVADRMRNESGDTCTINKASTITFDAETLQETDTAGAEVYAGKCLVRPAGGERIVDAGEGTRSLRTFLVRLPWDTTGVNIDHLVTITGSNDPHMIGRVLRVVDVQGGANNPDRVLVCEDTLTVSDQIAEEGS